MIRINNNTYPCRLTVGVLKCFKVKTGKELDQLKDMFAICDLLFMATSESCKKNGVDFPYKTSDELMDEIDISEIEQLTTDLFGSASKSADVEKKTDGQELTM